MSGAFLTRYHGFEGVMSIREGATEDSFLSEKTYLTFYVDGKYEIDGQLQRLVIEKDVDFSTRLDNEFKFSAILISTFPSLDLALLQIKDIKEWKRIEVIKDYKFYIVSMNMLAMPWIATGVFVYQSFITESKNWGPFVIAQSFMSYSVFSVITLFISGFLIDKFTSRKLLIFMNIPLFLSTFVIIYFDAQFTAFIFLGLIGISNGLANVLGSSTWAEVYGVKHIGSIKALTTALMVFSTAFGTALFGILIDIGFSIEKIALISALYILISFVLLFLVRKKLNPILV